MNRMPFRLGKWDAEADKTVPVWLVFADRSGGENGI